MQDSAQMLKIKEVREKKSFSQDDIVRITGIPKRSYVNYENGITDIPFLKLQNIANALGVPVQDLIENKNSSETSENKKNDEENSSTQPDLLSVRNEIRSDLRVIFDGMVENFRVLNDGVYHVLEDNQKVLRFIEDADKMKLFETAKGLDDFLKAKKG